jgi:hypothetical protein
MGKTHSKPLAARHGRGAAWERRAMCESALTGWWSCEHDNDLSGTIKRRIAERLLATGGLPTFVIELYGIKTGGINTLRLHCDHISWSS